MADGVPGMAALRDGPSKAAFVSRIIMVRGTGTGIQGGTGTANKFRGRSGWAASFLLLLFELKFF